MKITVPLILALVVLAAGTYVEGRLSDRWGKAKSVKLSDFSERLKTVPYKIDDWVGEDDTVDPTEFKASNCDAYVSRTYTNAQGQMVNVYLVSGTARHVTIHTPDWCYVGAGFEKDEDPQQYQFNVPGVESEPQFLTTVFRKEEPLSKTELRIFWSFSDDGQWSGPRLPKGHYAGRPALFKVYLITDLAMLKGDRAIENNPALDFSKVFLPVVNKLLFPKVAAAPVEG